MGLLKDNNLKKLKNNDSNCEELKKFKMNNYSCWDLNQKNNIYLCGILPQNQVENNF